MQMRGCGNLQMAINYARRGLFHLCICKFAHPHINYDSITKVFPSTASSVSGNTLIASSKSSVNVL